MTSNSPDQQMTGMKVNIVSQQQENQSTPQPVIIGNVNAANLFTTSIGGAQQSTTIPIPANLMGLSHNESNQVVRILPVFIHGSNILPNVKASVGDTNDFGSLQKNVIVSNANFEINTDSNSTGIDLSQLTSSSSLVQPLKLESADTLILSSTAQDLTTADTLPILMSSSERNTSNPLTSLQQTQSRQGFSACQSVFSFLSNLPSNKSVALDSIPTISLFKPHEGESKGTGSFLYTTTAQGTSPPALNSSLQETNTPSVVKGEQVSDTTSNTYRVSASDGDGNQLQIDETMDDDTDTETNDAFHREGEKRENSLNRDDTVILPTTLTSSDSGQTHNGSPLAAADTLIISNQTVVTMPPKLIMTAAGLPLATSISNSFLNSAMLMSDGANSQSRSSSLSSIPSLMLTDSMVEGHVNPSVLFSLLSQHSINDPLASSTAKYLSLEQFLAANSIAISNSNVVSSMENLLPQSSFSSAPNMSSSSSCTSVKGTQTNWVLGNSTVYLKLEKELVTSESDGEKTAGVTSIPIIIGGDKSAVTITDLIQQDQNMVSMSDAPSNAAVTKDNDIADNQKICMVEESMESELPFQCQTCNDRFPSKRSLEKHEKCHKKVLKCDLCTTTFTRMGNYTRHRKIHNLKPECQNVFTCSYPKCGRNFLQRCDLKRHELIHTNEQPYRCDRCGKGYIRRSDLVVHMRFHNKEKVFQCDMCDKSYYQTGDLSRHVRKVHKPDTQLTCGHCSRKYACETTLIRHMKVVHKDIILESVNQEPKP